jgi:CRISPR-associated protein Cst2
MTTNSITITYLSKVSFASLNGGDKEEGNIIPIKKITLSNGEELPYVSSQALRRALRDRLTEMGWTTSPINEASVKKGAVKTSLNPTAFIDDDLFGYMDAAKGEKDGEKGTSNTRTSPVRVDALLALSKYQGDLDFGTNYMGKDKGLDPNIFETEIHSGIYRGSILIELDRVGAGQGFEKAPLSKEEKSKRVLAFIDAFRTLWSSGRQSRFLADISPKFVAAALMKAKNPIFLESVSLDANGTVNVAALSSVISDYSKFVESHVFAAQNSIFPNNTEEVKSLADGFTDIENWVKKYYEVA